MPIPTPQEDEDKDQFMDRCMSAVDDEFDSHTQKVAVCLDKWREHQGDGDESS